MNKSRRLEAQESSFACLAVCLQIVISILLRQWVVVRHFQLP